MSFKFPNASSRVSIMGATGSGKTRFGVWLYSFSPFRQRPYVMIDYKGDDLIGRIDRAEEIGIKDIPKHPGLYILRPDADDPAIEDWLKKIHERGNTGLFLDEGYMVPSQPPRYKAMNRLLTQGRSKKIPMTILTQRPNWITKFVWSEASYFAVFRMQNMDDYGTISGFVPQNSVFDFRQRLPEYHARWYDVAQDYSAIIEPVPLDDEILDLYDRALKRNVRDI